MSTVLDWPAVQAEALDILQRLIRFDTTNPPGNEQPAAEYLQQALAREGIESEILLAAPGRANLVARLHGDGSAGGPLAVIGHIDVVYADPREWTHPPFAAQIHDGYIWGRGALDMKSLLAMEVVAFLLLKRLRLPLRRDVILVAAADEEASGHYGARWLVQNHWRKVQAEYVLNEGGESYQAGEREIYLIGAAEKGYGDLTVTAHGRGGHSSTPRGANAVAAIGRVAAAVDELEPTYQLTETVFDMMQALAATAPLAQPISRDNWRDLLPALLGALPERVSDLLRFSFFNVFTPTMLSAGVKENVIPSTATANINVRTLPGVGIEEVLASLQPALPRDATTVDVKEFHAGSASSSHTPFYEAIAAVLAETAPGAVCAPYMCSGATDSGVFRSRGVCAYGLAPMVIPAALDETVHARDERLPLAAFDLGLERVFRILERFCARP